MSDETTELQGILDEFEHECFMLRVEASETRARGDVVRKSYERIRDEFTERIAATLGSEREKALEELVQDWQVLYEEPDYGDCIRLRKKMQELGIEVIDE